MRARSAPIVVPTSLGTLLFCLPTHAIAQQTLQAMPVPGPLKDAGVYHVATGTWTGSEDQENLGSKVLYSNTASRGYVGYMTFPCDLIWTDEGRIPSVSGHPNAKSDAYAVNGFQFAYCTAVVDEPQLAAIAFYECYASCTNPAALCPLVTMDLALPACDSGVIDCGCWIVTFDLKGTSLEFVLDGDCDEVFDGTSARDDFGWTLTMYDQATGGWNGPYLTGDPNNFPYGDGTYYQNPGATLATGLGTIDHFWLNDAQGYYPNGCYWFGGYQGGNPFASFWLELLGENRDEVGTPYCTANANSTGDVAQIEAYGTTSASAGDLTLTSEPVPDQPGMFFHGANQAQLPFGNGFLCTTGGLTRGTVVMASCHSAEYVYDNSDAKHSLTAFVGSTRHFQHWFRDPLGGGAFFNTSNALSISLLPDPD